MTHWVPLSELLPPTGYDVLVFNGKSVAMLQLWKCNGKNHWICPGYIFGPECEVEYEFGFDGTTHWAGIEYPKL